MILFTAGRSLSNTRLELLGIFAGLFSLLTLDCCSIISHNLPGLPRFSIISLLATHYSCASATSIARIADSSQAAPPDSLLHLSYSSRSTHHPPTIITSGLESVTASAVCVNLEVPSIFPEFQQADLTCSIILTPQTTARPYSPERSLASNKEPSSPQAYQSTSHGQTLSTMDTLNQKPGDGLQHEGNRSVRLITDKLERPSLDDRSYRVIRLSNELEVLLVHDAETDKASASMDVNVGAFKDGKDMPGLAHSLEHMLFMGTKKVCSHDRVSSSIFS